MTTYIRNLLSYLTSFFPTRLPQGRTEFDRWSADIICMSGLPDNDSMRFAVAAMVINLPPLSCYKSKRYFVWALKKGAANEVAGSVFQELKLKQQAELKALKAVEEARKLAVVSDGPQKQGI